MPLTLYYHPFSSYCWKVLIPLYEAGTPFAARTLEDPQAAAEWKRRWPIARFPVLVEEPSGLALPEAGIIVEYLDSHHPGPQPLFPFDADTRLEVRLIDRFFDNYVHGSLQRIVSDRLRPAERRDAHGVCRGARDARHLLRLARYAHGRCGCGRRATASRSPTAPPHRRCSTPTGCIRSAMPFGMSRPIGPGSARRRSSVGGRGSTLPSALSGRRTRPRLRGMTNIHRVRSRSKLTECSPAACAVLFASAHRSRIGRVDVPGAPEKRFGQGEVVDPPFFW